MGGLKVIHSTRSSRRKSGKYRVPIGQLVIFRAGLEADELALFYGEAHDDRAAADATILDIFLTPGRTIDEHIDLLTAVGTTNRFRL